MKTRKNDLSTKINITLLYSYISNTLMKDHFYNIFYENKLLTIK